MLIIIIFADFTETTKTALDPRELSNQNWEGGGGGGGGWWAASRNRTRKTCLSVHRLHSVVNSREFFKNSNVVSPTERTRFILWLPPRHVSDVFNRRNSSCLNPVISFTSLRVRGWPCVASSGSSTATQRHISPGWVVSPLVGVWRITAWSTKNIPLPTRFILDLQEYCPLPSLPSPTRSDRAAGLHLNACNNRHPHSHYTLLQSVYLRTTDLLPPLRRMRSCATFSRRPVYCNAGDWTLDDWISFPHKDPYIYLSAPPRTPFLVECSGLTHTGPRGIKTRRAPSPPPDRF